MDAVDGGVPAAAPSSMRVAREIARDYPGIVVFQASEEIIAEAAEWSQPVQFRFEQAADGTYELLLRIVTWKHKCEVSA